MGFNFQIGDIVTVFGPVGGVPKAEPRMFSKVVERNMRFVTLKDNTKWGLNGQPYPKPKKEKKFSVKTKASSGARHLQHIEPWKEDHEKVMQDRIRRIVAWKVVKNMLPTDLDKATPDELETFVSFAKRCMPDHFYDENPVTYKIVFGKDKEE